MNYWALLNLLVIAVSVGDVLSEKRIRNDCGSKKACGEANIVNRGRIVNGKATTPNKWPWMAAMFGSKGNFQCGGSVISDKTIVTAAHCVFYSPEPMRSTWMLGMHDRDAQIGERFKTTHIELHPKFANSTHFDDFDIALVTVDRPINFGRTVNPICLPSPDKNYVGHLLTVIGWGKLNEDKQAHLATVLMETKVWQKTDEECTVLTSKFIEFNPRSMICAHAVNTDACQGDSGGPIFVESAPNRYELLGVVSFGEGCAREMPGIYGKLGTRFTLNWIRSYIEKNSATFCNDPPRVLSSSFTKRSPTRGV